MKDFYMEKKFEIYNKTMDDHLIVKHDDDGLGAITIEARDFKTHFGSVTIYSKEQCELLIKALQELKEEVYTDG